MTPETVVAALTLSLFVVVIGCDRDEPVRAYQAPKETTRPALAMAPSDVQQTVPVSPPVPSQAPSDAQGAQQPERVQWQVPQGWKRLPGSQMRYASFQVLPDDPGLLLTVIPLGPENTL